MTSPKVPAHFLNAGYATEVVHLCFIMSPGKMIFAVLEL